MKKLTAILLAAVLVFTMVAAVACNRAIRVRLHVSDDETIVRSHAVGEDDLPAVTNGDLEFGGWYYDKALSDKFDLSTDKTQDGTTLYAKWLPAKSDNPDDGKVKLTLDPNYTGSSVISYTIDKNSAFANLPDTFERNGYTFGGWYTQAVGGFAWTKTMPISVDTTLYAHWTQKGNDDNPQPSTHTHDFGDNYFMYVKCSVAGCNEVGRKTSANPFRNDFTYNYTQADRTAMDNAYNSLIGKITAGSASVKTIDGDMDSFLTMMDNVEYQYQVATVMLSVNNDDTWEANATLTGNAYNDSFQYYYMLIAKISESKYKDELLAGWTDEEIADAVEMAAMYAESEDNLQNVADALAAEYNNVFNSLESENDLPNLYEAYSKYVQANNNIAAQYGDKYDNYMDYAYANEYGREYTPSDVAAMRNYVKTVIAPILIDLYNKYQNIQWFFDDNYNFYAGMEDDCDFYEGLTFYSLFTPESGYEQFTYDAINYVGNYFKYLNKNITGNKEINFYKEVNELFKNGNYFTSAEGEEGAYTYFIKKKNTSIMYFDDSMDMYGSYYYSTAFTFVHEFGHYYADIYTNGANFDMDHAETHSQGDEMLFLAYLKDNCPKGAEYGYKVLQTEQLVNILQTIVQSTVVDEFEQAVYANTYGDGEFKDGIEYTQYADLYAEIINSYGDGMLDILGTDYWMYVAVDSSAYYISYAMSALPSLEIFVKAMTDGLDAARDTYFKLFTYGESMTYAEVLSYAGLANPFEQAMYDNIKTYFDAYTV